MLDGVEAGCGAEVGKSKESVVESEVSGCKMSKKMQARVVEAKKEFKCEECEEVFRQKANLLNHKKCSGEEASGRERRKWERI